MNDLGPGLGASPRLVASFLEPTLFRCAQFAPLTDYSSEDHLTVRQSQRHMDMPRKGSSRQWWFPLGA